MEPVRALVIVDAANVVGSRPDGWWRDRKAATQRLRDRLAEVTHTGLSGELPDWATTPPVDVLLVAEGAARGIDSSDTVSVVDAPGTADDHIAELVARTSPHRPCLVVTSDRGLRARVVAAGGHTTGASTLH
ncbi:NTP pyrophosphohydrolase [Stackebrandtia soli]|uniref:NTP pyrophosphohydrolase n=1 Tax=Stackebrandtia soli TaxID=1892856 RepID=UPI0039EC5624